MKNPKESTCIFQLIQNLERLLFKKEENISFVFLSSKSKTHFFPKIEQKVTAERNSEKKITRAGGFPELHLSFLVIALRTHRDEDKVIFFADKIVNGPA